MWNILFWTFCICFLTLQKKYENIKYFISCWRPSQCGGAEDGWIIYEARALSSVFRDILPFFWDKYILQFETNTLCNLRQLNHLWGDSSQLRFLETLHLHLQNVVLPISFVSPQILLSTFTEYFHVNICKCYRQTCLCLFWFSGLLPSTSASSLYSYNLPTFCDLRLCWVWFIAVCFWISLWNS